MNIDFTPKELEVIEAMVPGKTAEEIINMVLRDWFASNRDRFYKTVKTDDEINDAIISIHSQKTVGGKVV